MNIIIGLVIIAVCYAVVYGIASLISAVATFIKLPWLPVIVGCIAILKYLRQISIMNYVVIVLSIVVLGRLVISQITVAAQTLAAKVNVDSNDYREALGHTYASLYTFLVFGTLYVNLNYLLIVQLGGISFEEYKESGILNGQITSWLGLGPVKWVILILAAVAFIQAYHRADDFNVDCGAYGLLKRAQEPPANTEGNYFSGVLGIPIQLKENTVEESRSALQKYFSPLLHDDSDKVNKLTEAVLNVFSFEITDLSEILESLMEDSGLSTGEIVTCIPKLNSSNSR